MRWTRSYSSIAVLVSTIGLLLLLSSTSLSQSSNASYPSLTYTPAPTQRAPALDLSPELRDFCVLICDQPTPTPTPTPRFTTPTPAPSPTPVPTPSFSGEWRRFEYGHWDPGIGCPSYDQRLSGLLVYPPFFEFHTGFRGVRTILYCYYEVPDYTRPMTLYLSGQISTTISGGCNPVGGNRAGVFAGINFFAGQSYFAANYLCWPFQDRQDTLVSGTVSGPTHMGPRFVLNLQGGCAAEGCTSAFADLVLSVNVPYAPPTPTPTPVPSCNWVLTRELGFGCSGPLPGPGRGDARLEFSCTEPGFVSYTISISPTGPYTSSSSFVYLPEHRNSTTYRDTSRGTIQPAPAAVVSTFSGPGEVHFSGTALSAFTYLDCGALYVPLTPTPTPTPRSPLPDPPPGCRWSCVPRKPVLPSEGVCFYYEIPPGWLADLFDLSCKAYTICVYDALGYVTQSMSAIYAMFGLRVIIVGLILFYGFLAVKRLLMRSG